MISGVTASSSTGYFQRLLYSLIMGVIASVLLIIYMGGGSKGSKRNFTNTYKSFSKVYQKQNKQPTIYVYENFKNQYKYRIEDNKIYEGFNQSSSYVIKDNKIYRASGNVTALYRIEAHHMGDGQRVYKGLDRTPAFKVVDNKVYKGELGNHVLYRLSDSPHGAKSYSV